MITIFGIFLLSLLVITAVAIVRTRNLIVAVMLAAIFSLLMAANFFILDAADVALTEAAVGAGVTTVILLSALALTAERERSTGAIRWVSIAVVVVTALVLLYATFDKPQLGDPNAPVHQHVAPWYLENTTELIDIPNVVTAILASYRGYDTLGEVFVVFAAFVGVLFVLSASGNSPDTVREVDEGLRHHLIPRTVGRMLLPLIILFGLYVQFHGEYGPGGGFQAGAIIATGFILHALLQGEQAALVSIPRGAMVGLVVVGASLYGLVGILGIVLGGSFLDYSVLHPDPVTGRQIGIIVIELGVGMAVCGALLAIFHAFAARTP
jgi:multicomponent Na+:H+ antiporter subunit B